MVEKPYMPHVSVRRVANGWIVQRGTDYSRDSVVSLDEVYVFVEWAEAAKFISEVTLATRPASSASEKQS